MGTPWFGRSWLKIVERFKKLEFANMSTKYGNLSHHPELKWDGGDGETVWWHSKFGTPFDHDQMFQSRHGEAVLICSYRHSRNCSVHQYATGVVFPDGKIGNAITAARNDYVDYKDNWRAYSWLRKRGQNRWPGQLRIQANSLIFVDAPRLPDFLDLYGPRIAHRDDVPSYCFSWLDLMRDMVADQSTVLEQIQDIGFAASVFMFFHRNEVFRISDEKVLEFASSRSVGSFIAALRRIGEDNWDFTDGAAREDLSKPEHFIEIADALNSIGYVLERPES